MTFVRDVEFQVGVLARLRLLRVWNLSMLLAAGE